ncbi:MAG: DoxX family protein [Kordiimonadaceae bacterium]|nr:DoxX family protein [Kordiimonadaceae bacterium]
MLPFAEKLKSITARLQATFEMKDFVLLWLRIWVAEIFYESGRTKVGEGFFELNDYQAQLFEEDYGITFVDPEMMAQLAVYMETFLPIALLIGLGARFGALGLAGMALFIQIFVYPTLFWDHLGWLAALLPLMLYGPGKLSLDHLISKRL